jgi:REP element-mobilizing transposase RayT
MPAEPAREIARVEDWRSLIGVVDKQRCDDVGFEPMKLVATKHSRVELFVHVNWTTKERAAVLDRALLARLAEQARSTAQKFAAIVMAFGGVSDHVHVVARYRPDLTVSKLVQSLKGSTSHLVRSDFDHLPDFSWQTGYAAFSVGPAEVDRVVAYVNNQESHHADDTVWPEFEPGPDNAS